MNKKLIILVVVLLMSAALAGCGGAPAAESVELGIIQLVEHPALDAARQGFVDVLAENGYKEGENLVIDFKNGQNDQSTLKTIANKFASDQKDLILAIATPAAISMASETQDIPILITAVTDPVEAKLVESAEAPGTNVTGTTDMTPMKEQFEFLHKIVPDAEKVGVIYNSSEINSQVQAELAAEEAGELGITTVEATVTTSAEVPQVAQSLIGKVDAIYVPTDNTIAASIASVVAVAEENKIPLIVSEKGMVEGGALGTIGIDYYKLGRQTGEMALRVLAGENPAEMPIESQSFEDIGIVINKGAAERMGAVIPQEIMDQASEIIE